MLNAHPASGRAHPAEKSPGSAKLARVPRVVRAGVALLVSGLCWAGSAVTFADESAALELQVKAAFLVKFGQFVEWPAATPPVATNTPFRIGLLGEDPFGETFDQAVKKESVKGRRVQLRRGRTLAELGECEIIFICGSEVGQIEAWLKELAGRPVLTVADSGNFARRGGMLHFIKEAGKMRFEVNLEAADRARLKLSAKLLQVGRVIAPHRSGEGDAP